jgi:hypothetical protein
MPAQKAVARVPVDGPGRWAPRPRSIAPAAASRDRLRFTLLYRVFLTGFKNRVAAMAHWAVAFLGDGRRQLKITKRQAFATTKELP